MSRLVTVRDRYQITIPKELRDRFAVGGQVEIVPTQDGGALLRPMKVVPANTPTHYSAEDMANLIQMAEEARQGIGLDGPYTDMDQFIRELRRNPKAARDNKTKSVPESL